MKFSDIERADWEGLKPYLDTCLLPVTGLTGFEQPWEATQELEYLRDIMDCIEGPYKGRIVTYPAFHYVEGPGAAFMVNSVCQKLKGAGFRYVILITGQPAVEGAPYPDADLMLCPEAADGEVMQADAFRTKAAEEIGAMWRKGAEKGA
ncbi:DUF2487 family protein [Paenibacillus hodogayensis]|uniref:DUF2487 family protein n=1 Tax=Paenibacillus hodogayensis TaxID=279208 RepID=A0ABV5W4K5_9BACL